MRATSVSPQRWAFFAYAHNLGDLTRAIETAKGLVDQGHVVRFFVHGGNLELIRDSGLEATVLQPEISAEQDRIVMDINQFRAPVGTELPFSEQELREMVLADLNAMEEWQPDAAYCGLNFSSMVSTVRLGIPRVTMVPTSLCPAFYEHRLASFPATMERSFLVRRLIPGPIKRWFFNRVMLRDVMSNTVRAFNAIRTEYGQPHVHNPVEFVKSDLVLLPDLPELIGLPEEALPDGYEYTGPIFANLDLPIPSDADRVLLPPNTPVEAATRESRDTVVYLTLGSSGTPEVFRELVSILRSRPGTRLICSTTSIIDPDEFGPPTDRFFAARYLPSHLVAERVDLAVTHGGQGTIQNMVWAGIPVVGIGFQAEQQANIDGIARAGMAVRIPLHSITPGRLLRAVDRVATAACRGAAGRMRDLVRRTDGVMRSVELMEQLVEDRRASAGV